jgi:hypothetical protein
MGSLAEEGYAVSHARYRLLAAERRDERRMGRNSMSWLVSAGIFVWDRCMGNREEYKQIFDEWEKKPLLECTSSLFGSGWVLVCLAFIMHICT